MSSRRGQRVVGWAVGPRAAWVEEVSHAGQSVGFVTYTRDGYGTSPLGEFCFIRGEAEMLAKVFVGWPE